jgi:hypothetical protein
MISKAGMSPMKQARAVQNTAETLQIAIRVWGRWDEYR